MIETKTLYIGGMTCVNCRYKIEKKLKNTPGIEDAAVSYNTGIAKITYQTDCITLQEIIAGIEKMDYQVSEERRQKEKFPLIGILIIILALYMILQHVGVSGLTAGFPLAEAGMGYGMLFVIGLITSVHCAAMCGGINLSQCIAAPENRPAVLSSSVLYNSGRVISYTVIGVLVGALGSVITLSGVLQGGIQIFAGVFMVIMGLNMLGLFPELRRFTPRLPRIFAKKIEVKQETGGNPLFIGLLNGLMPCGPLQAMQLYALSTGNPLKGGISMFLFSLGTVPLMFGIGALSSLLSRRFTGIVMKIGAIAVAVLGLTMISNGWILGGLPNLYDFIHSPTGKLFNRTASGLTDSQRSEPVVEKGVQLINSTLSPGRYPAITVQAGVPVKWTITVPPGSINGCNNRMIIRQYGIEHQFKPGENIIEFTPDKTGKFSYSCWMGMIRSSITVVEEGASPAALTAEPTPKPAGVPIPTDTAAVAQINAQGIQEVQIVLTDDGFEPSIIVVQRFIPVQWIIDNHSLDAGNGQVLFPAYRAQVDMEDGDNAIQLIPQGDFDFSTLDNVFYGYVKVVDDLTGIDLESIKAEIANFETLIYPEAYFDATG